MFCVKSECDGGEFRDHITIGVDRPVRRRRDVFMRGRKGWNESRCLSIETPDVGLTGTGIRRSTQPVHLRDVF